MSTTTRSERLLAGAAALALPDALARAAARGLSEHPVVLLAINGKLASGKDTVAPAVLAQVGVTGAVRVSFANGVRAEIDQVIAVLVTASDPAEAATTVAATMTVPPAQAAQITALLWDACHGVTAPKATDRSTEMRAALQFWGTEVRRAVDVDYWVRAAAMTILTEIAAGRSVYVTDVRFPNEAGALAGLGFTVVRLEISAETQRRRLAGRDGLTVDPAALSHPSETALDNYPGFDLVVDNNGELETTVGLIAAFLPR